MKELKEIPNENPFRVPDNYFGELEGKILAATTGAEKIPERKWLTVRLMPVLSVAATVALLIIIGYSALHRGNEYRIAGEMMREITVNEFTEIYLNDIDLSTLEERVAETGLIPERTGVSKVDIIDYLMSENIDVFEIYENL